MVESWESLLCSCLVSAKGMASRGVPSKWGVQKQESFVCLTERQVSCTYEVIDCRCL